MFPLRSVPPSVVPGGVTVIWNGSVLSGSPLSCTVTENVQAVPLLVPVPLNVALLPVMVNVANVALWTFAPVAWLTYWRLPRSEEHTSELQSQSNLVCRLLLEKKKKK